MENQPKIQLPAILQSKRFWTALIGMIFMVLVSVWPEIEEHTQILQEAAIIFVSLLIGGYALEDYATAKSPTIEQSAIELSVNDEDFSKLEQIAHRAKIIHGP